MSNIPGSSNKRYIILDNIQKGQGKVCSANNLPSDRMYLRSA
jgi:hypothetical protein